MSNVNVESGGEASGAENQVADESSNHEKPTTKNDSVVPKEEKEKTCENGSDTTPKPVNRPSYIPPHLMGRDLNDPAQDMIGTGRRVQKPRLGVKVPYRNLTSQIVSQDEIAQEILERSLRKYSYAETPDGGDVFFAMKLTHRLANKITPAIESPSTNDKAGSSGGGNSSTSEGAAVGVSTVVAATKKPETAETSIKRSALEVSAVIAEKSKEAERKNDAIGAKNPGTAEKVRKTSQEHCKDASKSSETSVNFESKADQLYAEISSTLGEDCKISKPLKITSSNVNSHTKLSSPRMANGSISLATTETELDNDTLLAILEGTSDVQDISMNVTASPLKLEVSPQPQTQPLQQQQPPLPPPQQPPPPPPPVSQQQQQQHQRKKRIKPMLDPNIEKELALKQLMDFETKKTEDRLKKSAAKKLKLDEEMLSANQLPNADSISNSNINNSSQPNSSEANNLGIAGTGVGDSNNLDAVQDGNAPTAVSTAGGDPTRPDVKPTLTDVSKSESTPSGKKTKKTCFSGGSIAPKRFPKKYQRIIKRQLRSSKLKAKTTTPDQQQQTTQQPPLQKKLPEVPEVQIAIDRYIKTYASKRKHKPEIEVKASKNTSEANSEKNISATTTPTPPSSNDILAKTAGQQISDSASGPGKRSVPQTAAAASKGSHDGDVNVTSAIAANVDDEEKMSVDAVPSTGAGVDEEIKENESPAAAKPKANSKVMREINRLLGDEGAINMIYSIEQKRLPDSRRDTNILPSLRRKKKDLLLKTKLVKNAVLRLSMSPGQLSPGRVRRTSPEISTAQTTTASAKTITSPSRKASIESVDSNASEHSSPKVRKVAAEASRIIRRHSSSSAYSSDEDECIGSANAATSGTGTVKTAAASNAVTETAKNKSVIDKSVALALGQPAAADVRAAAQGKSAKSSDNTKETVVQTSDKRKNSHSHSNSGKENDNIVVEKTKNHSSNENTSVENEEPAAIAGHACSTKRKDSKEGSAAAKIHNESSTVSTYSELTERLRLKEITLRKYDNLVQIILISSSCKMKNAMNIQVFNELISVLNELQKDDSCRTVLLTSTGSSFCQGIDLQALIRADISQRRKIVDEYVTALSTFTVSLSQFKKILIAGVHGSAVGLGVTMLPFFDMVFASDKATFYTPYVKLGQIPEAGATLTLPHLLGNAVTSELLFGCRMLTAGEALQFGLVTRILWPDKFGEELLPIARSVASNSSQSMEATKCLLRKTMNEKLQEQLTTEAKLLQQHWSSDECQRRFKDYLQQEALLQNK